MIGSAGHPLQGSGASIAILGAGAWGTALAIVLTRHGHSVTLWGHHPGHLADVQREGVNHRYLPGIPVSREWRFEPDLRSALAEADSVVLAVPSKAFRTVAQSLVGWRGSLAISVTKGIEYGTGLTMCGILREIVPKLPIAALSGPSLAMEVAKGIPTAVVVASTDPSAALQAQQFFNSRSLRVYSSHDEIGVELAGALKNVVAIAAGVCDGLGFGDNSKAALITRGVVEIRRLGVACGAQPESFSGLSGLGDLTVTCFSKLSRNRAFGERLGRGEAIDQLVSQSVAVAEGYPTARAAWQLARKRNIVTPIIDETYALLYEGKSPAEAVRSLMTRDVGNE